VSTLATTFDEPKKPRWSKANFPSDWKTHRIFGTIIRIEGRRRYRVLWDDGDETEHPQQRLHLETATDEDGSVNEDEEGEEEVGTEDEEYDEEFDEVDEELDEVESESGNTEPACVTLFANGTTPIQWSLTDGVTIDERQLPKRKPMLLGITLSHKTTAADIFLHLLPMSTHRISALVNSKAKKTGPFKDTSPEEILLWLALFIGASLNRRGNKKDLFRESRGLQPSMNLSR